MSDFTLNPQQLTIRQGLRQDARHDRLSHAYAFTGNDESGKRLITLDLIQSLVCQADQSPCGQCSMCQRVKDNQLADVIYLKPEGQSIKVDQIRDLREWLSRSPVESNFKLAVIEEAHTMNAAASNALLKFLEEPVDNVYMILYSPDIHKLLPTIQSRVQERYFKQTDFDDRYEAAIKQGMTPPHAQIAARLPMATAESLCAQYESEAFDAWLEGFNYFYRLLLQQDSLAFVAVETHLKATLSVDQALAGLEYLWLLNYSMLMALQGQATDKAIQSFLIHDWQTKFKIDQVHVLWLNQHMIQCKERILANVSPQLALESLAIIATEYI